MNQERDKFLTEAIGECWHDVNYGRCIKCNKVIHRDKSENSPYDVNSSFSTWQGFGKLVTWVRNNCVGDIVELIDSEKGFFTYIEPDKFADLVYNYLKNKN